LHVLDCREVHAWILAYRCMRAGTRLHADDAFFEQHAFKSALDMLGILSSYHVVSDDEHLETEIEQLWRDRFHDRGLARADRTAYADTCNFLGHSILPIARLIHEETHMPLGVDRRQDVC